MADKSSGVDGEAMERREAKQAPSPEDEVEQYAKIALAQRGIASGGVDREKVVERFGQWAQAKMERLIKARVWSVEVSRVDADPTAGTVSWRCGIPLANRFPGGRYGPGETMSITVCKPGHAWERSWRDLGEAAFFEEKWREALLAIATMDARFAQDGVLPEGLAAAKERLDLGLAAKPAAGRRAKSSL